MDALALFDTDLRVTEVAKPTTPATSRTIPEPAPPSATVVAGPTVLAVDGNSLAHRGYHAYAARRAAPDTDLRTGGDLVGAGLYGFLALLAAVVDMARPH